ncbi:ABC transporter ATP-binding protein [Janthinobacterium agaricidamnosum]|uniref:ABC transporter family protein n=1 Tax=Janthinobacterium agaricidamnosum NBRC 102515 = DSM 9628 TaxID=1349767 RepID=W0V8W0_9BURK|nr:ABC transporter ATP-binding protein [Janthinobacterium agaricidamnosum]CDG83712.1 ABC transporter family protein [Janthinobacterium agaricidamnosum NBRC 102515 = DSM 9628]
MKDQQTLTVRDLHACHQKTPVLHGIDLSIEPGKVTVIVGPNGCGKSTLLRCMARLHQPSQGSVRLGADDLWRMRPQQAARRLALLPQAPQAPEGISVAGLVSYGRHPHQGLLRQWSADDERAVREAMQAADVTALAQRPLEQLSGGQRQRCWLAMVLAQETPLLLLDEPTSMLDLGHQVDVLNRIRQLAAAGRGVVMVLHDLMAAARYADTLVALRDGRVLASGAAREIVTPQLVRQLYQVDADVLSAPGDGAPVVVPAAPLEQSRQLRLINQGK